MKKPDKPSPLTPLPEGEGNRTIIKLIHWLPAFLYMALIFYMSSHVTPEPIRAVPIYYDIKLVHVIEYGILSALYFYALDRTTKIPLIWKMIYAVMLTYIYGLTDELHQVFVLGRSAKLPDTIANFIGASITQAAISLIRRSPRHISDK